MSEGKAGYVVIFLMQRCLLPVSPSTFVNAWQSVMKMHETMAENRIRFAQRLNEMSEELNNLSKEVDKTRKSVRFILVFEYQSLI